MSEPSNSLEGEMTMPRNDPLTRRGWQEAYNRDRGQYSPDMISALLDRLDANPAGLTTEAAKVIRQLQAQVEEKHDE
jgi:hypothetical protein